MASVRLMKVDMSLGKPFRGAIALVLCNLGLAIPAALAKEPSLNAIELYNGTSGSAYVQLADVLINGKAELRNCSLSAATPIDKSAYAKLQKMGLTAGGVLERGADGVLRYSNAGAPAVCVVPENVKFEHNASFSPAAMAELAELRGRPIAPGSDGAASLQPLKNGVKLVFVLAPDIEQAEFLLAQRVSSTSGWLNYLAKYQGSPHAEEARRTLATLYIDAGEKALSDYLKTASTTSPSYADLKNAKTQDDLARALLADSEPQKQLAGEIQSALTAITDRGRTELDAYNQALASSSPGYAHLQNAKSFADSIAGIDSSF